ncbi:ThiF family adenylyltransferase [Salinicola sp. V024]|uniref:ThiF family adenylyltransferase n=1 Tax=Salinicola sp. V024 TaxID=3459609 RepID=UPI0040442682
MVDEAPKSIRVALDRLLGVPGIALDSHPEFISAESAWAVRLRLTSPQSSDFVPEQTRWVVLIDGSYPAGRIRIFPAQNGGIIHTFPHQDRNVVSTSNHATWRTGKLCLDSPSQRLGRIAGGLEPKDDVEQRLRWHVERCLAWLEVAANDQLMVGDEPFEVPQYPFDLINPCLKVIHDEGEDSWPAWGKQLGHHGEVHWSVIPNLDKTIVAEKFFDSRGDRIRSCRRGYQSSENPWIGYWWLWPSPIVTPPWHAPGTWAELRRAGARLNVDIDGFFRWMVHQARGKEDVIILLGYPIPSRWNGAPVEVHWQAISSPEIPKNIKPMKGFRDNVRGRYERLRWEILSGTKKLSYLATENWHPDRLQARGRLHAEIRKRSVALIGAGALGSAVAELLVRGGVAEIIIIDHDALEAGNLVRHTLTGEALGHNKAKALAERLQAAAPMSQVNSLATPLPQGHALQTLLEPFDVVLDCTGDDDVLRRLDVAWWPVPRRFLSASLGFSAARLFLFRAHASRFPLEEFTDAVEPWLEEERSKWTAAGETLEGAGCWSPLFPARSDDVWLAAVATVKYLERSEMGMVPGGLRVLEQRFDEGLAGYQVVELERACDDSSSFKLESGQ